MIIFYFKLDCLCLLSAVEYIVRLTRLNKTYDLSNDLYFQLQYVMILDIVNNLLLHVELKKKVRKFHFHCPLLLDSGLV